ncbi:MULTISPECIES: FAD-dependent oxidoreductase [Chitinophagaceae]
MKIIIIGGVAGGATAAARIRRLDESAEIVMLEKGVDISYANCGLPYYLGRNIEDRDRLVLQSPAVFRTRFRIDVRVRHEVIAIDPATKCVMVRNLDKQETIVLRYDKLLISTGASGIFPSFVDTALPNVFGLRTLEDMDCIDAYVTEYQPKRVAILGAGFIGLEAAENLRERGLEVVLLQREYQVLKTLDYALAVQLHGELDRLGIQLKTGVAVVQQENGEGVMTLVLDNGERIVADMLLVSIGIRPNSALAMDAGIAVAKSGGIIVDDYMQTSEKDIYAVGDVVEVENKVLKRRMLVPLAGPANKQARIAADNIVFGNRKTFDGAIGTSILKLGALTAASAGATELQLQEFAIPFYTETIHGQSHASYYPGSQPLSLKINYDPVSGRLLGAQVVGGKGVDARIDVMALVMQQGGTVYDLLSYEHAYAPPYSSAKDLVNMIGFVAENRIEGLVATIQYDALESRLAQGAMLVDVRTREEFEMGHIAGAVNVPLEEIRTHVEALTLASAVIVYCQVGLRGYNAARILTQSGVQKVYNLSGGYKTFAAIKKAAHSRACKDTDSMVLLPDAVHHPVVSLRIDACGLQCPGPVLELKKAYEKLENGQSLSISVTDPGFVEDVQAWCRMTGATVGRIENDKGVFHVDIVKHVTESAADSTLVETKRDNKTFIVFSNDFDKVFASLIIANGAIAAGKKVTLFFTFWGLAVIRKASETRLRKSLLDKMFGKMLPANIDKLQLSKMNMLGIAPRMMHYVMKSKKVTTLQSLIRNLIDNGAELIACSMSMDVMGIRREELWDEVKIAGVAAYLDRSEQANLNLFI